MKTVHFNKAIIFIIILMASSNSFAQQWCGFDDWLNNNLAHNSSFKASYLKKNSKNSGAFKSMNSNEIYTIPVVFHIYHRGQALGVEENVLYSSVLTALDDLNIGFSGVNGSGPDTDIRFCLAQRMPDGSSFPNPNEVGVMRYDLGCNTSYNNPTTGFRVDCSVFTCSAEATLKSHSALNHKDYLNIWVTHYIKSGSGSVLGNAGPPGSSMFQDGVVIRYDHFGNDGGRVLNHEVGHYLDLLHTFEEGSATICPPTTNGNTTGDKCCDTKPHKWDDAWFNLADNCDESLYDDCALNNNCNPSNPIPYTYEANKNYMNLADCGIEFTDDQRSRMRNAIESYRSSLLQSLACQTPCNSALVSFLGPNSGHTGISYNFTSVFPAIAYQWFIDDIEVSNNNNLTHSFDDPGVYQICLRATDGNCTNEYCDYIQINDATTECNLDPTSCELVLNGSFDDPSSNIHTPSDYFDFNSTCNWYNRTGSFQYCGETGKAILTPSDCFGNNETIGTTSKLNLQDGKEYILSYDYSIQSPINENLAVLSVGLSRTLLSSDANTFIDQTTDLSVDFLGGIGYDCERPLVHHREACFIFDESTMGKYLFIEAESPSNRQFISISNISVKEKDCLCDEPDFSFSTLECEASFEGMSTNPSGTYYWNFGDGTEAYGQDVSHIYIYGGTFEVCLSYICHNNDNACGTESIRTICKNVTIPEGCNNCESETILIDAIQCQSNAPQEEVYLSDFSFQVPKNAVSCIEDDFFMGSEDGEIEIVDLSVDKSNPNYDVYSVSFETTPDDNPSFLTNGMQGHITLCTEDGELICFEFLITATSCENCLDTIKEVAECLPNTNLYFGEISIPIPINYVPCGTASENTQLSLSSENGPSFTKTLTYSIEDYPDLPFEITSILCFEDPVSGERSCITLDIQFPPCVNPPPVDCAEEWLEKDISCSGIVEGMVRFNFAMDLSIYGYSICPNGLTGHIFGMPNALVVVNSASSTNSAVQFNLDIYLPCDYDKTLTYFLVLDLCDRQGRPVCFLFPLDLNCNLSCDEDEGGDQYFGERSYVSKNDHPFIEVFPNPTSQFLHIRNTDKTEHLKFELTSTVGHSFILDPIDSGENHHVLDIGQLTNGLYFLKISNAHSVLKYKKVIIAK